MTTKREIEDRQRMFVNLARIGISYEDATVLRRISLTLHRWHEHECNGTIQRDGENQDGRPYHCQQLQTTGRERRWAIADRERGALKRLTQIMARYPTLGHYVQGDPRGAALYILRPGDVPTGEPVDSYYSRGLAVY